MTVRRYRQPRSASYNLMAQEASQCVSPAQDFTWLFSSSDAWGSSSAWDFRGVQLSQISLVT
jgi:hypothetical protein